MNSLPQNELLSAYLDGELTAAEQADVERLLAANPAARQTLDDLRALSTVLQSLPQQKLGEDLSAQVLRVAERRMLTEGEPDAAAPRPAESLPRRPIDFRRFINRRTVIWTALAVAMAVMIAINERNQQNQPADKELARGKAPPVELARGPAGSDEERSARYMKKSNEIPAFRAAPDSTAESPMALAPREKKARSDSKPGSDDWKDLPVEKRLAGKPLGGAGEPALEEQPSQPLEGAFPAPNGAGSEALDASRAAKLPGGMAGRMGAGMSKAGGSGLSRKGGTYSGKDGLKGGQQFVQSASDVLVVYCDISPEAAKKKSLAKLLDANGIEWRRERTLESQTIVQSRQPHATDKDAAQRVHDELAVLDTTSKRAIASGSTELVYAEATPAQVRAALAGLEAQPNVFLSFSVKPSQDAMLRQLADRSGTERGGAQNFQAGNVDGFGGYMGQSRTNERETTGAFGAQQKPAGGLPAKKDRTEAADAKAAPANVANNDPRVLPPGALGAASHGQPQAKADTTPTDKAAAPPTAPAKPPSTAKQGQAEQQRDSIQPPPGEYYAQSPPRQRVLFVLRVSGASAAVAAEVQSAGGGSARIQDKAKAAAPNPAKSPPAEPVPSK